MTGPETPHEPMLPPDERLVVWRAQVVRATGRRAAWSAAALAGSVALWRLATDPDLRSLGFIVALTAAISLWNSAAAWRTARARPAAELAAAAREAHAAYEAHDARQREVPYATRPARFTYLLCAVLAVVCLLQFRVGIDQSVELAGLIKPAVRDGEWWRMFSGAFLHAGLLHLGMNASALYVVGRLMETHLPPLRLPLVYLAGLLGCSAASLVFSPDAPSVGASGAIIGMIGFLWVVAQRNPRLLPPGLASGLGMSIVLTGFLGVSGVMAIDNAGHAGGTVAGALLGALLYGRRDADVRGGGSAAVLDLLGWASLVVLLVAAAFTGWQLI